MIGFGVNILIHLKFNSVQLLAIVLTSACEKAVSLPQKYTQYT